MQETWVLSLGGEDPLEKEMAIHSSILAWEIPWTEEPGGLQSIGLQRARHDLATEHTHTHVWRQLAIYAYLTYLLIFINSIFLNSKFKNSSEDFLL